MNIWFIHPYAGSPKHGMSFRPYYFCKHFQNMGYEAVIISSSNHHLSSFVNNDEGLQTIESVPYYLVKTLAYTGNGIKRVFNMLNFGFKLFGLRFRKFAASHKPRVIIASTAHPFHFLAAKYYANKYDAKLILEVRDIWPLSLQELVGISKYHPLTILINAFQKYAYRNCDHCVSLLENAEPFFIQEGLAQNRFTCIPNGIEVIESSIQENFELIDDELEAIRASLSSYDTVIGYTGAIGVPNNLLPLIKSAKALAKHNIGVLLVGSGVLKSELESYCHANNINNVAFFNPVSKNKVPNVISFCDAMFINSQPKEIYKYGISPNKIFDYMEQNKPIFNGINSPNNPMEKAGVEIRFDANDSEDLSSKIIRYHYEKSDFKVNSKCFVRDNFSYSFLAKQYSKLFTTGTNG